LFALPLVPAPASAQWSRVLSVPNTRLFSITAKGDTVVAGADTVVYVSTNGGATFQRSSRVAAGVGAITAVRVHNRRVFAGTFGQGVFVSDDLGATWHAFNEGLIGGFQNSQLDVIDLPVRADTLYAGTAGAGVYARGLSGAATWHHFGEEFEPNQASNVTALSVGGSRLLASAGANGQVFRRDPGEPDWTISDLDNQGLHPGVGAGISVFNGFGWVVGTNAGLFTSVLGQEPWTRFDPGLGPIFWTALANRGRHLFAAIDIQSFVVAAFIEESEDDGASWELAETLPDVFVQEMGVSGAFLYAARSDGLFRRAVDQASVPPPTQSLRFALAGAQPFKDRAILRFELPEAAAASIDVFDVQGRRVGEPIRGTWSPGPHEVSLDAHGLSPGVYAARLESGKTREMVRLVHVR